MHVGDYDGSDTNKLQSRPGATKVLFMDVAALTLAKAELWRAWQIVSGAYSAFEVNVTTDAAVYEAAEARNRGKACISNEDGRSTCSVNAFGTSRCCDVYNKGTGIYQGLTTSHELGHLMGLQHDGGGSGGEYFEGLSAFKWVPVMGNIDAQEQLGRASVVSVEQGRVHRRHRNAGRSRDHHQEPPLPGRRHSGRQGAGRRERRAGVVRRQPRADRAQHRQRYVHLRDRQRRGRATLVIDRIEYFAGAYLDVDAQIRTRAA